MPQMLAAGQVLQTICAGLVAHEFGAKAASVDLDDALIEHLRRVPRASVTELAAATYYPRRTVRARLQALIEGGTVSVIAAIHPGYLGVTAFAHLAIATTGPVQPVLEALAAVPSIVFLSAVSGEYQAIAEVRQTDERHLADTVAAVRAVPGVAHVNAMTYVEVLRGTFMPLHPLPPDRRVDAIDDALMTLLQEDGRVSYRSLAAAVGLSPSAARERVNALLDDEIIRIAPILNHAPRSAEVTAGIGINVAGAGETVERYLRDTDGIDFAARTIGRHDLVATVLADSAAGLVKALDELRALDEVARLTSWIHLDVVKERYDRPDRLH